MPGPDLAYFRATYAAMDEEELATLSERAARQPEQLTEVAREALRQIIAERGIQVAALLRQQAKSEAADRYIASEKHAAAAAKKKIRSRVLGKVLGLAGLATSAVILISSIKQMHAGGGIAALATAGCSLWLLLRYKGD